MDEGQQPGEKGSKRRRKAGNEQQASHPASQQNTPFSLISFLRKRKADEERRRAIEEEEERRRIRRAIAKKRRAAIIRKLRAAARRKKGTGKRLQEETSTAAPQPVDEDPYDELLDDLLEEDLVDELEEELPDDELDQDESPDDDPDDDPDEEPDEDQWEEEDLEEENSEPVPRHERIPRPPDDTAPPFGADFGRQSDSNDTDAAVERASAENARLAEPFSLAPGETLPPATPARPASPAAIAIGFVLYFLVPAILAIGLVVWILNRPDSTLPEVRTEAPPPKPRIEDLISTSQAAAQRGDLQRAGKVASQALTLYPEDFRSHLNAASLKIKSGQLAQAGPDLKRASELAPKNPDPISMRAEWAFLSGFFKEARDLHRKLHPYSTRIPPIITLQLYVCEMALGNTTEADRILEKNPIPSPSLEWFWLLTLQARHEGNINESRHLAESTIPLYGDQAKAALETFRRLGWPEKDLLAPTKGVPLPSL